MYKYLKIGTPKDIRFKLGVFIAILQATSAVALLATSAWLISRSAEHPPVMYLMIAVVGVRGFALGRAGFRYAERVTLHDSAFRMLARIRPTIFSKLIPFAPAGIGVSGRGELINRVVSDVDELQNLSLRILPPLMQSAAISILSVVGLSLLLPSASLVLLFCLMAAFFIAMPLSGAINSRGERELAGVKGEFENEALDLLEHFEILRAYGWLPAKRSHLQLLDGIRNKISNRSALGSGVVQTLFSLLSSAATICCTYLAADSVRVENLSGVNLAVVALLPLAVFDSIAASQNVMSSWKRYKSSAIRLMQITDRELPTDLAIREPNAARHSELRHFDSVKLTRICAGYPGQADVLKNFSFEIHAGETISLVGPSGIGKSTVAMLLLRFLEPRRGSIEINGLPANNFDSASIRTQIGYLEQTPTIFLGSVRANLLIAKPDATDESLIAILKQVGLWHMFQQRQGLETELGDRGVLISGGEAQRIALARSMLANFKLLILDEPTASVDRAQSLELMSEILKLTNRDPSKSVILITHDPDLASMAGRIVKLE